MQVGFLSGEPFICDTGQDFLRACMLCSGNRTVEAFRSCLNIFAESGLEDHSKEVLLESMDIFCLTPS